MVKDSITYTSDAVYCDVNTIFKMKYCHRVHRIYILHFRAIVLILSLLYISVVRLDLSN